MSGSAVQPLFNTGRIAPLMLQSAGKLSACSVEPRRFELGCPKRPKLRGFPVSIPRNWTCVFGASSVAHAASFLESGDGVSGQLLVLPWVPEVFAGLAALPWPVMAIDVVGVAQAEALVRILTAPAALKGGPGRATANPRVTTRRLRQRCRGVAAEAAVLAWNG